MKALANHLFPIVLLTTLPFTVLATKTAGTTAGAITGAAMFITAIALNEAN